MENTRQLAGRHVLLGVTGGIAAYKVPELVRRLRERGADVRVVLSHSASQFVAPGALAALGTPPLVETAEGMLHIDLARWADVIVIAPATAHVLARLAHGLADDLLTTTCLASTAPIYLAPAMNQAMWQNAATQDNRAALSARGLAFIGPAEGAQACGDTGPGRMAEVAEILAALEDRSHGTALQGVRAVVTAGPTYEPLDAARGVTNRSSGKMGYAIAAALAEQGASVTLVSGPTSLATPHGVRKVPVLTALEMHSAVLAQRDHMQLFVGAAAVADYRPQTALSAKLKKSGDTLTVTFVRNPDILAEVAALAPAPFTVGFAAETHDLEAYAREKLMRKGLDLIVANPIDEPGTGFASDHNRVTLIDRDGTYPWASAPKTEIARRLALEIGQRLARRSHA